MIDESWYELSYIYFLFQHFIIIQAEITHCPFFSYRVEANLSSFVLEQKDNVCLLSWNMIFWPTACVF